MPRGRKPGANADARRERFRRVAERRANQVLDRLRVLGNCANAAQYSYTPEEIAKMFGAIDAELERTKGLFEPQARKQKPEPFTF
jgi:hypothetical protein